MIFSEREIDLKTLQDERQDEDIYKNSQKIKDIEEEFVSVREEVNTSLDNVNSLIEDINEVKEEVTTLLETVNSRIDEGINEVKEDAEQNAADITELQTDIATLQSGATSANERLDSVESNISGILDGSIIEQDDETPTDTDNIIVQISTADNIRKKPFSALWNYIKSKCEALFQPKLVSGVNIKTINGASLLDGGNIDLGGNVVLGNDDIITLTNSNGVLVIGHASGPGFNHIPSGGSLNKILRYKASGEAQWSDETTYATLRTNTTTSNNLQSKSYLVAGPGSTKANTTNYLRGDGTWGPVTFTGAQVPTPTPADVGKTLKVNSNGEYYLA